MKTLNELCAAAGIKVTDKRSSLILPATEDVLDFVFYHSGRRLDFFQKEEIGGTEVVEISCICKSLWNE